MKLWDLEIGCLEEDFFLMQPSPMFGLYHKYHAMRECCKTVCSFINFFEDDKNEKGVGISNFE